MKKQVEISISDIVGSGVCISSEDGSKVFEVINSNLKEGRAIKLSFKNIEDLTSAFLNSAIGQLYGKYTEEQIRESLSVTDYAQDDLTVLTRVVERAKQFFKDPDRIKKITDDFLGKEADG